MRRLVVTLAVLAALLVVADRVAVGIAQGVVARQLQASAGLSTQPTVRIGGFPFLTQALAGTYQQVAVDVTRLPVGHSVTVTELSVSLHGLHVPLSDVLRGSVAEVPVDSVDATARLSPSDINAALAAGGQPFRVAPAAGGLRLVGQVSVLGRTFSASAVAAARLDGNRLVLTGERIDVPGLAGVALPPTLRVGVSLAIGRLPFGLSLRATSVAADGVRVSAGSGPTVLRRP